MLKEAQAWRIVGDVCCDPVGRSVTAAFVCLQALWHVSASLCPPVSWPSCASPLRHHGGSPCGPAPAAGRWPQRRSPGARWEASHEHPRVTHAGTSGTLSSRPRLRSGAVARRSPATPTPPPTALAVHHPTPRSVAYAAVGRRALRAPTTRDECIPLLYANHQVVQQFFSSWHQCRFVLRAPGILTLSMIVAHNTVTGSWTAHAPAGTQASPEFQPSGWDCRRGVTVAIMRPIV
jgi:hypothetical protein